MSMPGPEHLVVASDVEVEPLVRAARAEIAQLSLQIRAANHEAAQLEDALAEDDTRARDLLRASLDEFLESRRGELEKALEEEVVRGAALVAATREELARARPLPPVEPVIAPPSPEPRVDRSQVGGQEGGTRRLLQVVGVPQDDLGTRRDVPPEVRQDVGAVDDAQVAVRRRTDGGDDQPILPVDETAAPAVGEGRPGPDVGHRTATAEHLPPIPTMSAHDGVLLRELVSAAVAAAVSQGIRVGHAAPPPRLTSAEAPGPARPAHASRPSAGDRTRPRRLAARQLLHVDVVLPLVLVVIVFVVLLAWVG